MTLGLLFWIIMLLWFLFGILGPHLFPHPYMGTASNLLLFVLFLVVGWQVFGAPVR